ncbi:MAG: hypothetical protein EOP53_25610, partial [Sphingobacteriales bacterium]
MLRILNRVNAKSIFLFLLSFFLFYACKKEEPKRSEAEIEISKWEFVAQLNDANQTWNDVCFSDPKTIWSVGNKNFVAKSTDGGKSWEGVVVDAVLPENFLWISIYFQTANIGWVCGQNKIYKTIDGGKTWKSMFDVSKFPQLPNGNFGAQTVHFISAEKGFFCGNNGFILSTIDGGKTWNSQIFKELESNVLFGITFSGENNGWIIGNTVLLNTTNGGANWQIQQSSA